MGQTHMYHPYSQLLQQSSIILALHLCERSTYIPPSLPYMSLAILVYANTNSFLPSALVMAYLAAQREAKNCAWYY